MEEQQPHGSRQIHAVESAVGLSQSPFITHYDSSLHRQQQMHQHIAAVSHMQQTAQLMPQMIHITGQQMQQAMQLQESFQFFQPVSLQKPVQLPRVEEMHRAAMYPINAIFVSTEDKNCCLKDRGTRCSRPAGTAGFTHRIRDLVSRSGALLTEDINAGHQYICDHHKNYIQKLRVVLTPGAYLAPDMNHGGVPTLFSPFPTFTSPYSVETLMQYSSNANVASEPEDYSTADGVERAPTPNRSGPSAGHTATSNDGHKRKDHSESNSAPVDMRKVSHSSEVRNAAVSVSPEKESPEESSDEYDGGPAASDLLWNIYSMEDLLNYVKHFEIDVPSRPSKEELSRVVCDHMDTVPVGDIQNTLTSFFHAVKTDTRAFSQPYTQALSVGFDLSSDEEMMLIKDSAVNGGDRLSRASDAQSESEPEEDVNTDDGGGGGLSDVQFDAETQRALAEINEKLSVSEIERILGRYSLPIKHSFPAHESDTESSSSDERRPVKRSTGPGKKRQRMRNSDD